MLRPTKKKRSPFQLFQEATFVFLRESRVYVLWEYNIKKDLLKMRKDYIHFIQNGEQCRAFPILLIVKSGGGKLSAKLR
jgi:hypothetical protein